MIKLAQPNISESAIRKVNDVLRSGQLVHGIECQAFEEELASYLDIKHALVVSNGTAALHVALLALDIGVGDAVIVPDFTFAATANIVEITGAKAIIVDVESDSYNMDSNKLIERIKNWQGPEKLKAIMPVLEFGNPSNIDAYKKISDKYGLHLIEDAACALGAKSDKKMIGTFGDFGCFSFHPRKTLTTGEGGVIVTDNTKLFKKATLIRNHGMVRCNDGIEFKCVGLNYRLTNFQAVLGRDILPKLDDWIEKRRKLACVYLEKLKPLEEQYLIRLPKIVDGHSVQTFMIVLSEQFDRKEVMSYLYDNGVESNLGAQSMSSLELYDHKSNSEYEFEIGSELYYQGLALPLHENLKENDIYQVIGCINEFFDR